MWCIPLIWSSPWRSTVSLWSPRFALEHAIRVAVWYGWLWPPKTKVRELSKRKLRPYSSSHLLLITSQPLRLVISRLGFGHQLDSQVPTYVLRLVTGENYTSKHPYLFVNLEINSVSQCFQSRVFDILPTSSYTALPHISFSLKRNKEQIKSLFFRNQERRGKKATTR